MPHSLTLPPVTVTNSNVNERPVKPSTPPGRSARWAAHRKRRRAELIDAAVRAVREHGAGVSVAMIAAAAGVTKPVLYRHFADRADLQYAVSEQAATLLLSSLLPEVTTGRPANERVRAVVEAFLAAIEEEPELWRFVVHNPGGTNQGTDVVAHNIGLVAGLITSVLVDELRRRDKDAGGAEAWAFGLAGMVYTAGDWWLQRRTMSRSALADYLTSLILGGLSGLLEPAHQRTHDGSETQRDDTGASASGTDQPDLDPSDGLRLVSGLDSNVDRE